MLTQRLSLLAAYAVVLTCGGAAPPPPPPAAGGAMTQVASQAKDFPRIPPSTEFDTTPEWSDHRRLTVGECPRDCRLGPLATIHPRTAAALWSEEHRDSVGEVIAMLISDSAYKKFNLQYRGREKPDTVYWAVVKRGTETVSIFRSTTPRTPDLVTTTDVVHHGRGFFRGQSIARFIWNDRDDMVWGTCDGGACCKSPRM